jgi:hypothetical protein
MSKYKLIKEYPGSPCLGTVIEKQQLSNPYLYYTGDKRWCVLADDVENNPEYWEKQVMKNKNLISISGAIGSGKDTVGKIIQYLLCENKGEMPVEDVLKYSEHDWWRLEQSGFEIKKFAGKLKQVASLLTGVPVEKWEDQSFKSETMPREWWVPNRSCEEDPFDPVTYRLFLQVLGTEVIRDTMHPDIWVNALFSDYRPQKLSEYNPSKWIITDTRFHNELEAVIERKGITINVVRPEIRMNGHLWYKAHSSETSLKDAEFDYEIVNDAGIPELVDKVKGVLIKEGIL